MSDTEFNAMVTVLTTVLAMGVVIGNVLTDLLYGAVRLTVRLLTPKKSA